MKHIQLFEEFINEKKGKEHKSSDGTVYYVEEEKGPGGKTVYVVVSKAKGGQPTEAWDDWFGEKEAAEEVAQKLASGELDEGLGVYEADDEDKKSTDRGPLDSEELETGVKNKAEESGCPIGIIRAVFRRGMAAWKSGHRPGAGQEQWAYARVNSFLTGGEGTWGKADADLAKEARAAGFNPKK
jgi:hypothetical protein